MTNLGFINGTQPATLFWELKHGGDRRNWKFVWELKSLYNFLFS